MEEALPWEEEEVWSSWDWFVLHSKKESLVAIFDNVVIPDSKNMVKSMAVAGFSKNPAILFAMFRRPPPKPFIWIRSKALAKPGRLATRQEEPQPADELGGTSRPYQETIVAYHCNPNLTNLNLNSHQQLSVCTGLNP